MRIVGGRLRGRPLLGPSGRAIRPTSDRLRESVFDILAHGYGEPADGAEVLDLFAGTGALGLEALSRGAGLCCFVDASPEALALIRGNLERMHLTGSAEVLRADATGAIRSPHSFSLVFLDPPYGAGLALRALAALGEHNRLAPDALVVVEEARKADFAPPPHFEPVDARDYGDTRVAFLRFRKDARF